MVEEEKKRRKKSAVLEPTLATAQNDLSLSWGWATVDQYKENKLGLICAKLRANLDLSRLF